MSHDGYDRYGGEMLGNDRGREAFRVDGGGDMRGFEIIITIIIIIIKHNGLE